MLENLTKKQKIIFGIIIIFMIAVIVYYIYSTLNQYDFNSTYEEDVDKNLILNDITDEDTTNGTSENTDILIHVSGCVKNNTVVTIPEGSRINDAIVAAGGLTADADLTNINLAYILEDGEKIYIPKKGEEVKINSEANSEQTEASAPTSSSSNKTSKININKATQAELETIPGIGPSTALKIINYREENGKFTSIEEIKNVSGIGDAKYENMKEYISVK